MRVPDFREAPLLVVWETTQACDLVCRHCRASAQPSPAAGELSTEEGKRLLRETADMGTPLFVLSGGDPAKRPDLAEIVREGKRLGLRMATIPAATPLLDRAFVSRMRDAGLDQIALSLDSPRAQAHDAFRGALGAFARTMEAVEWIGEVGIPLQINTTLCGESAPHLGETASLVERLGAVFWEVFFLVPVGRGASLAGLGPEACEGLFEILSRARSKRRFVVKVTEAPHFRRFLAQRFVGAGDAPSREAEDVSLPDGRPGLTTTRAGVNAGNGFAFVSHLGEVYSSGFLPLSAGNVRDRPLAEIYRESALFRALRDPERLLGRCGRCEFRALCGGSRSRAFALTGNPFETDPWCAYVPATAGQAGPCPVPARVGFGREERVTNESERPHSSNGR